MRTVLRTVALLSAVLSGCGDEPPQREWQPSDHGHPPEAQVDPSRVPGQGRGAAGDDRVDPEATRVRAAAALWRVSCAGCHGPGGSGGGPELPPGAQVPDMTATDWQRGRTDGELASAIRDGRGLMPAFGDRINPTGVLALVAHIRTLGAAPDEPPQPTAED
jgi:mono/diheme cytochrome c family protein